MRAGQFGVGFDPWMRPLHQRHALAGHRRSRMRLPHPTLTIVALLVAACGHSAATVSSTVSPMSTVPPGDWPTFSRTLAGDRFSPLAEIDRSNVARLAVICRY